jgi:hypothetical protein
MDNLTRVLLAVVSLAVIATVLVNANGASTVVKAGSGAFTSSLSAAEKG